MIRFSKTYPFFLIVKEGVLLKSSPPSLPLKKAPPLISYFSPQGRRRKPSSGDQNRYAIRLAGHQSPRQVVRDGTAGGQLDDGERMGTDGWDHQNRSSLQYRSALVATRMRNIVFILLLIGLPQVRCPSGLWRSNPYCV